MPNRTALIVVDVQNDFCPGGALPVAQGGRVVPVLNRYIEAFRKAGSPVFASRDWHPEKTAHFKDYGGAWPPHCVQGTEGAGFHPELKLPDDAIIITKGDRIDEDSYSAFQGRDAEGRAFAEALKSRGVGHIYVGGLATDYCVRQTVLDGLREGLRVTLLLDAVRGVDLKEGDSIRAIDEMIEKGADTAIYEEIEMMI